MILREKRERVALGLIEMRKNGERPSMLKAVKAKCRDCMCNYVDGRLDCEVEDCSLYFWMPYGKVRRKSAWETKPDEIVDIEE
ncbi:MAG: hypothetical protein NG747_13300 [Candidatus Brocadia sp.]|nr:hypothetical protein [Candidatus Brocadia sp.]